MAQPSKNGNVPESNMNTNTNVSVERGGHEGTAGGVGSPISNEAYNVIAALASKLEGLEAYRKYAKDGEGRVWKDLTQIEIEGVQKLCDELERIVKDGKLRMREPGKANA
jgi:hypothetical protein